MEVVLVRHAHPEVDPSLPSSRWPLSPAGVEAAERLARRLDTGAARVISSDETKALQTAEPIAHSADVGVEIDRRLREVTRPWVTDGYERLATGWLAGRAVEGWEPHREVIDRMEAVVEDAAVGSSVVLVGHGLAFTAWLASHLAHLDPVVFWRDLTMPDAWHLDLVAGSLQRAVR